jgi:predicted NUDIX family NTP pyrophosphohydrolase
MPSPSKVSAGLLLCRRAGASWEFLLVHPGGPFFARKDEGAWSIPKGLVDPHEELLVAAQREFQEETGFDARAERYLPLGQITQKGGKTVHAWAFEGDCDPSQLRSNTFELEWPPRSGRMQVVPEVDRAGLFAPDEARRKLLPAQAELIDRALTLLE